MGNTTTNYFLLLVIALFSSSTLAADYSCQVESDFRIRDGDNINEITGTRLSGSQVCVGEPVVRRFKKANGEFGSDTFRQIRLANGDTGWISAKGVSNAVPVATKVVPLPMPRPSIRTATPAQALPQATPQTAAQTQLPTAPAVAQMPAQNFDIDEGFRLRASPDSSNNSNVVGSTTGTDNLQPVYTNGMLDIQNGFIRASNGSQEVWIHESAVKSVSMPAIPMYDPRPTTAALPAANIPTPAATLTPAPVVPVTPAKTTAQLLAGVPQVDPGLQRGLTKLEEQRRAHNLALLNGLQQVDPNLQRAIKKIEDERRAHNQALLQGLPQVDPPLQRAADAKRRAHNEALLAGLQQVDPNLQRAVVKLEEEKRRRNAELLASVPQVDVTHRALIELKAKKEAELAEVTAAATQEAKRLARVRQQQHNQALLADLPQVDPAHQRILDAKAKKEAELALLQAALDSEAQRRALAQQQSAHNQELIANVPQVDRGLQTALDVKKPTPVSTAQVIFLGTPVVDHKPIPTPPADLQAAVNAAAERRRLAIEAAAATPSSVPANQTLSPLTAPSSTETVAAPVIAAQPISAESNVVAGTSNNFLTQLNPRNWLKVGGRTLDLYNAPGLEGTTKMAELRGARIAVVGTKRVQYMFEGRQKDEIWLKIVPFDCQKLDLVGDPNMQPDDTCNQVYWVKGTSNFLSTQPPTAAELAARPTPESYLEAAGFCENCELPKSEADAVGDAVQAHAN